MRRSHCRTNPREAESAPKIQEGVAPTAQRQSNRPRSSTAPFARDAVRSTPNNRTEDRLTHWHRWCRRGSTARPLGLVRAEGIARAQHRKARSRQRGLLPGRRRERASRTTTWHEGEAPGRWLADGGLDLAGEVAAERSARAAGGPRPARPTTSWCAAPRGGRAHPALTSPSRPPSRSRCCTPSAIRSCRAERSRPTSAPWARRSTTWRSTPPSCAAAGRERARAGPRAGGRRLSPPRLARRRPALHTHVLVANLAQDAEGRFGALDCRAIYRARQDRRLPLPGRAAPPAEHAPRASSGAGAQGGRRDRRRPGEVIARLQPPAGRDRAAPGRARRAGARAAEVAALDTRRAKELRRARPSDLFADWRAPGPQELGFGRRELEATLWRGRRARAGPAPSSSRCSTSWRARRA